jgi:hypothetical protein
MARSAQHRRVWRTRSRKENVMTSKSEFTEQEWELLRDGPPTAGMIAAAASSGGSFRESWALAKALTEARQHHGESELLDAIVAERPHAKRYGSPAELEEQGLAHLREAVALIGQKSPQDADAYKSFTLSVAERVAEAHKEGGAAVSTGEHEALDKIATAVGATTPEP